ncbi:MAG: hypothetical protein JWQ30_377 [Sediminibacterium sp.]|nr:hypothetical protein [Sediminibacterium sp.]
MYKNHLVVATFLGGLSVMLGAFAAHTLKTYLDPQSLTSFETGVRYQFYHVFALALAGILYREFPDKKIIRAGTCFILGIVFFSGSLYVMAFLGATSQFKWIGAITPIGGVLFILGWFLLGLTILQKSR